MSAVSQVEQLHLSDFVRGLFRVVHTLHLLQYPTNFPPVSVKYSLINVENPLIAY